MNPTPHNLKTARRHRRRYLPAILLLFLHAARPTLGADAVVAEVNQAVITDTAVQAAVDAHLRLIGHKTLSPERMDRIRRAMLKRLIEEELLYQEGLRAGLSVSGTEITAGIKRIKARFPSEAAYHAAISKKGLTPKDIRRGVVRTLLIRKAWTRFAAMPDPARAAALNALTADAAIRIHLKAPFPSTGSQTKRPPGSGAVTAMPPELND